MATNLIYYTNKATLTSHDREGALKLLRLDDGKDWRLLIREGHSLLVFLSLAACNTQSEGLSALPVLMAS